MKKIIFLLLSSILFSTAYWLSTWRTCETIYSTINWVKYFSSLHCTEDIKLWWVVADEPSLRDVSSRKINDFIIANNNVIVNHLEWSGSCDDLSDVTEIKAFETIIYSNNEISFTTTSSSIETLAESIEELKEDYNSLDLYSTVYSSTQSKYPISSVDFLRNATREAYFDKQLEIKDSILDKQKEKLTLLYKLTESQKFIETFYDRLDRVCQWYDIKGVSEEEEEENEEEKEDLILEYKKEFNTKLWDKLDSMPRQTLQQLSVKLLDYAANSPVFKRFSEAQREIVRLKISGLKAAIDERLD